MTDFLAPVDIGNFALQNCGADLMGSLGFSEDSKRAALVSFTYDKVRVAELKRNPWVFSIKEAMLRAIDANTMMLAAGLWTPTASYFRGCIVADQSGHLWKSTIADNLNNDPLLTSFWEPYFGPLTVSLYASATSYYVGELVYTAAGAGLNRVYMSLQTGNSDNPATATPWAATTTFFKNQVVTYLSVAYMSLIDLNINNTPSAAPPLWSALATYAAGDPVGASDGIIYTSVGSGNIAHDPTLDDGSQWTNTGVLNPWTRVFVGGAGSLKWLQIGGAEFPLGVGLTTPNIQYPLNSGPSTQSSTRNAFKLPAGYLRQVAQNPKGTATWLGGPSGMTYNDWNMESGYLVSGETGPIRLRFGADVVDVRLMDPMFCRGLAASIAIEVCEPITQSSSKLQNIASKYKLEMGDARTANAIEAGYDDPPQDDYLTVRY